MTQWVVGYKAGVGLDYFENYRSVPPVFAPPPEGALLVLNGARAVRVRAIDSAERPVSGIEIVPITVRKRGKLYSVNLSGSAARARTDERGVATFDWFPSDVAEGTSFALATTSYSLVKWPILEAGKLDAVVLARLVRFMPISGKVTRPDGSPAAGILIFAEGVGPAYPAGSSRARTAADGSYKMALPANQSYMLCVNDPEWAATSRSGVIIREGQPHPDVDFRLETGSVIRGRVTAGPASRPAPGVAVMLSEQGPAVPGGTLINQPENLIDGATRIADTDSDGRYAFRVAAGNYGLIGPREPGSDIASEPLKVEEGQDFQRDFQLERLVRPMRSVRGVVRAEKPDGSPIVDAIVVAEPIGARISPTRGLADDKGRFELHRAFEAGLVYARDPAGMLAGYVTVDEDDDAELVIVAGPAATARGRVVDGSGKPYRGVRVEYWVVLETDGARNQPAKRRRRRAGGMMGGMIGGVMGGQAPRRRVPGGRRGDPIEGADGHASVGLSATTDDNGRFTAPGLLVGAECRLFAVHPDGSESPEPPFPVKDAAPIDLGDIVLLPR